MTARFQLTYAITPPNQTTPPERRCVIAANQSERIAKLPIDALLVYDLQDETSRTSAPRPFAFTPKVDALDYAFQQLRVGDLPRVVYRAIGGVTQTQFQHWLTALEAAGGRAVFVGTPSRQSQSPMTLTHAYSVCRRHTPELAWGGVLIAERHQTSGQEHERAWSKVDNGCRFFVSQTTWSVAATKVLLQALRIRAESAGAPVPPILLTLSPCGSEQTLLFQEWLGVEVPDTIKRELSCSKDMLSRSIDLAADVYAEISEFALEQGLHIGCNVESVSSRAVEVEAAVELVHRVAKYQQRAGWYDERETQSALAAQ